MRTYETKTCINNMYFYECSHLLSVWPCFCYILIKLFDKEYLQPINKVQLFFVSFHTKYILYLQSVQPAQIKNMDREYDRPTVEQPYNRPYFYKNMVK